MKLTDPQFALPPQQVTLDVLLEKYAKGDETTVEAVRRRVARALAAVEKDPARWEPVFYETLENGFIPGGRVNSAAGTQLQATLINCFVQPVGDSVSETVDGKPGIYVALQEAAETMRRGGGVGYDFSAIRPRGAKVRGTDSTASGPVSYMRVFDKSCETVESAGSRRGAQMGILRCDHPDIDDFIHAKDQGELRNFNISVAVTDAFMRAVESDGGWDLVHQQQPAPDYEGARQHADGTWIYRTVRARELWRQIMESTYDHAEPGVFFVDRTNADNNLSYCETIGSTNPCVTGDTWVMTADGPRQVQELVGRVFTAIHRGRGYRTASQGFFPTGRKPVLRVQTREGHGLRVTAEHLITRVTARSRYLIEVEWAAASDLKPGDEVLLHDHRTLAGWPGAHSEADGYLLGMLIGDGSLKEDKAVLAVWDARARQEANGQWVFSPGVSGVMEAAARAARTLPHRSDFRGWQSVVGGERTTELRLSLAALRDLALSLGLRPDAKRITDQIERCSSDFCRGLLRGLFDTDGSVQGTQAKGVSLRLTQVDLENLVRAQRMLLRLGIPSTVYKSRKPAGLKLLPNGKGGMGVYPTQEVHELVISGENLLRFEQTIGFEDAEKAQRLRSLLATYQRRLNHESFAVTVESVTEDGIEDVFDVSVPEVNAFDANSFCVHNCGEQPLPAYGCCCLGSINLAPFVRDPFGAKARFDFDAFGKVVRPAVRMLDNVLDASVWPLAQQEQEASAKRRIGLGFTGLGDALIMLGLRYDTEEARGMASRIAEALRDEAYAASIELAREKGAFPLLDATQYLSAPRFASRLPEKLKAGIRRDGIRNSHLLSIAPTGTISLAFADNASNGIEPPYAWTYQRKKRMPDNSMKSYDVEDHAWRLHRRLGGNIDRLPPYFVTAMDIPALDHMRMVAVVAPFVDSAISKTVNVPEDYPYERFKDLYLEAWKAGLKGITTYRPNKVLGSVLSVTPAPEAAQPNDLDTTADRRIRLEAQPQPALSSLRWPGRPRLAAGNPAWTYMVESPFGQFAIFVGHVENGDAHPFEVWVNGAEQPRGLGAVAKTLSMDMRAQDTAWLRTKLEILARTAGDDGFKCPMPPGGEPQRVPSVVAAFARIVRYRVDQFGALAQHGGKSPVLDALFAKKEPKTGPSGTMSWTADVHNPRGGDDFVLILKELQLPTGQRRPYSIWMAGEYPRALDGLCKLLSLDMRVVDPAWIGMKLRKLLDYPEPLGDFMARVPGENRQLNFPSTIAYVARLVIHRYAMLGVLDERGYPLSEMGVLEIPADDQAQARQVRYRVLHGRLCKECGNAAVIHKDGCEFCTACGAIGACG
jgi:ribonucleoside-diphosphate reductase alpha chain